MSTPFAADKQSSGGRRPVVARPLTALALSAAILASWVAVPSSRADAQVIRAAAASTPAATATGQAQSPSTTTGTFTESAAAFAFLTRGLGLPLGSSPTLTAARSGHTLNLALGGPSNLRLGLPTGVTPPYGSTANLAIDTAADTETVTSASATGKLSVTIANASTTTLAGGQGVTGLVTDDVSLLNSPTTLTGTVADTGGAATVTLSGATAADATLTSGVVLAKGTTVSLARSGGLEIAGQVSLGASGHAVAAAVTGTVSDTANWTLAVSQSGSSSPADPLPGLALANSATGTIDDRSGTVRYDVRAPVGGAWQVVPGIEASAATLELSDALPSGGAFSAPGVVDGTNWASVTGNLSTKSTAGTQVTTAGAVAFDLSSGAGLLNSDQSGIATLTTTPTQVQLSATTLTGHLVLTPSSVTGSVTGSGTVSVQPAGAAAVAANATVTVRPHGTVVVGFPLDVSVLGMGPAGTVETVYWASSALSGFAVPGGAKINLPAGLSVGAGTSTTPSTTTTIPPTTAPPTTAPPTTVPPTTATTTAPITTAPPTTAPPTTTPDASSTYSLSSAVASFLKSLSVPLLSSTLSGVLGGTTLTVTLPAPTGLPFALPAGIPAPTFGPTTITVDESADTLTLDAAASVGTGEPVGAALHVAIANASTTTLTKGPDLTATLSLTGVPFFAGTTLGLMGSLSYTGGMLAASLTGTVESDLPLGNDVVLMQGALVTLATGAGLSVSGTLEIGTGANAFDVALAGSVTDLSNWSLSLSDPNAPMWQPVPSLTITPTFAGSITDTDGTVRFDLATANVNDAAPLTWDAGAGAALSVTHLEVSDATPPSSVACPPTVADGDIWVELKGSFSYSPANVDLTAEGCIDLTAQTFTIGTAATGTLLPNNPLFNVGSAALTVTGDIPNKKFTVAGSAVLVVSGVSGQPTFPVGVSFGTDGLVIGAQLPDLSSLGLSGSGSVYVASSKAQGFDPAVLGIQGSPFDLPAGLSVALDYQLPANITAAFGQIGIDLGPQTAIQTVATLSSAGFSINVALDFGSQTNGLKVIDTNGTALFLNSFSIGITVGAQNQVSMSGSAFFEMPALIPGTVASQVEVSINGSFNFDSLTLSLGLQLANWTNALGIDGLDIADFAGNLGITFETGIPTPSLSISADNIVLPATWATAIGEVPGTQVSFDANINLDAPLLSFSIIGPAGQPALTPLAVATSDPNIINSLVVNQATVVLAPLGGITAAGDTVAPGISVIFDAVIDNVAAHLDASVGLAPPSLDADVSVASFSVGPVNVENPMLHLHLNPTAPIQVSFSGGVTTGNYTLTAAVSLALGNTANGASISLSVVAGLPYWLTASGTIDGSVSGDGAGAQVYAYGYGYLQAGASQLGPVSFTYTGTLSWTDVVDTFQQVAAFFTNAGTQIDQVVQILQALGDNQQDIVDTLNSIGIDPNAVLSSVTSVFGLINNSYDYIWVNPTLAQLFVLDVSGASQDPNASVIDWYWNGGYNQQWAFVPGSYGFEIVNRGSGQCLSVQDGSTDPGASLVQYPCYGSTDQLWNIGTLDTYQSETITSVSSGLNIDVAGASFFAGATIDQWYDNGGSNQDFWLTPGTN